MTPPLLGGFRTRPGGWPPAPTPRLAVRGHSRLTLMFVLRLEVVRPVVCGERRGCLGHRDPAGLTSLGPGRSHPKCCVQRELSSLRGQARLDYQGRVMTVASRGGSFSAVSFKVQFHPRCEPASRVRRRFPGHKTPLSTQAEFPLNIQPPSHSAPGPQPPFWPSWPVTPHPPACTSCQMVGPEVLPHHAISLLHGLLWLPPSRKEGPNL